MIDGLAFDNPPGSRNAHRWQDVEELLAAGINIVASVNLQYIEDQREAVEKITGKRVTQTIPREFLNTADEIVIVDAPTGPATERRTALRELALVLSADVIDEGLQRYLHSHGMEQSSGTHERLLLCLTPQANFKRMVASARRTAARFHCDVLAVYVRWPGLSAADQIFWSTRWPPLAKRALRSKSSMATSLSKLPCATPAPTPLPRFLWGTAREKIS